MANRTRGPGGNYPPSNAPRQNEYFVPRDGIDREVITADICRYLGNDALVRPGIHTDDTGRTIQGYYVTAYRNLTTAMIADLKNDSARWDAERRKHQSGSGTPEHFFSDRVDNRMQNPNNPPVRYQDSQIRDGPQRGMGGGQPGSPYGMQQYQYGGNTRDYDPGPRYPGSEAPGYSSGPGGPNPYGPTGGLGGYGGGGMQYQTGLPQQPPYSAPQQPGAQDPRYGGLPPQMGAAAGNYGAGNNMPLGQEGYLSGAQYAVAPNRDAFSMDMPMTDAPMAPARRASPPGANQYGNPGNNARGGYGAGPNVPAGGYGGYAPQSSANVAYAQPIDNGYGRAPTSNTNFNPVHDLPPQPPQAQQYGDTVHSPSPPRSGSVATNTQAQLPTSSSQQPGPRRDRERAVSERSEHRDRDRIDRPSERDRDRDRDATPPNRTGSATKPGSSSHHHYGGRR